MAARRGSGCWRAAMSSTSPRSSCLPSSQPTRTRVTASWPHTADVALDHVFGYTIMNDLTARDRQVVLRPDGTAQYRLGGSKNFDGSAPLGPVIVTTDQIPDPQALAMTSTVNGEVRQQTTTGHM